MKVSSEMLKRFDDWYSSKLVVIEMLKFHTNREMMFTKYYKEKDKIVPFKYTMCNSFNRFKTIRGYNSILGVYHHLETLKTNKMPWHLKGNQVWNYKIKKEIYDYELYEDERQWAFDIDAEENILEAYKEAKVIKQYMKDKFKCRSAIIFSGGKGFHVDCELYGPAKETRFKNRKLYRELLDECPHLDNIYGRRRAWRTPYSLHEKTGLVCFPLGEREIKWLNESMLEQFLLSMHPYRVWRDVRIMNRGYAFAD